MEHTLPIDWASVNWTYVVLLSVIALIASLIGHLLAFRSRLLGAILTAVLFGAAIIFWTYYPIEQLYPAGLPGWLKTAVCKPVASGSTQ